MKCLSFLSLCVLILGWMPARAALTGYMKIGDIKGESTASGHEDEIDIHGVSWNIRRSIPANSVGAQRTRGETTLGDIHVTKNVDKSTPKLMEACGNGTFFDEVVFIVRKDSGDAHLDYLKITMTDVIVTSVSTGGSGGEDRLTENVSLNFTSAEIVYTVFNEDGTSAGNVPANVQQSVGTP